MNTAPGFLTLCGWKGRALCFTLGAVAVLGQAPFHLWVIFLLSLAALYARLVWAMTQDSPGRAGWRSALWWALGYFVAGTFWIGSAFIARGPEFVPFMVPMVGGLAFILSVFWGVAGLTFARLQIRDWRGAILFAALFFLAEAARGHAFGGFPWNLPGYVFEAGGPISQGAALFGIYGQSWIVLIVAAILGHGLLIARKPGLVGMASIPILALFGFGLLRLPSAPLPVQPDINIRLVAVDFDQAEQMDFDSSVQVARRFIEASLAPGLADVTHLVWPEGAVNGIVIEDEAFLRAVGQHLAARSARPPVWLLNSLRREHSPDAQGRSITRIYNSSVAVTFDAMGNPAIAGSSDKVHLVPFGEYIPFHEQMERLNLPLLSTNLASISKGQKRRVVSFPGLPPLSAQICYEVVFSGATPLAGPTRPEMILNQSNDAWYGNSIGPWQHANIARYRAIETGLPIVRAASNGVTGLIDPYGRTLQNTHSEVWSHFDTTLPKSLKKNDYSRLVLFTLCLINIFVCLWCATIARSHGLAAV